MTSEIEQEIRISCPISDESETLSFRAGETKTVKFDLTLDVEVESVADAGLPTEETSAAAPEDPAAEDGTEETAADLPEVNEES